MFLDRNHINENSFQNFAKFFGLYFPKEENFDEKLNCIYDLIVNKKIMDINEISKVSNCTLAECVLKIKYLKNKRMIGDYYIDTVHHQLLECSEDDQKLLKRYTPFIYHSHLQIDEMIPQMATLNVYDLKDKIFQDLKHLDSKGLLNGVKIDDVNRRIIYYSLEKRKADPQYESIHCPNCGALNDVNVFGNAKCGYCGFILSGSQFHSS